MHGCWAWKGSGQVGSCTCCPHSRVLQLPQVVGLHFAAPAGPDHLSLHVVGAGKADQVAGNRVSAPSGGRVGWPVGLRATIVQEGREANGKEE